ncbi:MAG: TauD/TfdA family dioxygenase [Betaproteobacteria bacterium]|nr:TauD/TfdA family dioxygenase [Betaproteobacteria bacterium]
MSVTVGPLNESFGAEIVGFDVRSIGGPKDVDWIVGLLDKYQVIAFRDQELQPQDVIEFGRRFGPVQKHILDQFHLENYPEIYLLSNLRENGKPLGNAYDGITWHTDLAGDTNARVYTALYSLEVPSVGSDTLFASTENAWDALPQEEKKSLEGLRAVNSYEQLYNSRREMLDDAGIANDYGPLEGEQLEKARTMRRVEPMVRTHPKSSRKGLYLGTLSFESIEGKSREESRTLMDRLVNYCTGDRFRYAHRWRVHDLVVWDNRGLMHVATPYDKVNERRLIYRLSIEGQPPL